MSKVVISRVGGNVVIDPRTLAEAQAQRIAAIKAEAGDRILSRYPLHAQLNAQARATELVLVQQARAWTMLEAAEAEALQRMRDWIKAVRQTSNDAETAVMAATNNDAADAISVAWPA